MNKAKITCRAMTLLSFELQSSRSVCRNRNDAPGPMAATRASGAGSETELILTKIYQKSKQKKESGGVRGRQPPEFVPRGPPRAPEARAAAPPFQAANFGFSLLFCLVLQGNMVPVISYYLYLGR